MSARIWLLCAVLLASAAGVAHAEGEASDERLVVRPSLRLSAVATDNSDHRRESSDGDGELAAWIEPRLETEWRGRTLRLGADLGADLRWQDGSRHSDVFYDVRGFGEWEPLEGFTLRIADAWTPQALQLAVPSDDTRNLTQSNRVMVEARYTRESRRRRGIELGVSAAEFQTDGFPATLDLDGDGIDEDVQELHADHREFMAFAEGRWGLGRRTTVFLRGEGRRRRFEELPRADYDEIAGTAGVRGHIARRLEFSAAFGYGAIDFEDLPTDTRMLGSFALDWQLPRGVRLKADFIRRFTADAAAADFDETTAKLRLGKDIGTRTHVYTGALWTRFRSDSPDAESNAVVSLELGLRRQLTRRISAQLGYRHWRNAGTDDDDDFRQNRVNLELLYRF